MEKKHIQNITETDETVIITFGKSNPEPIEELVEEANNKVEEIKREEEKGKKIMETKDKKIADKDYSSTKTEKFFRTAKISKKDLDENTRTIGLSFSSETPYE